ncbi:MAG: hypothetical protein CMQ40_06095 [Gammaproteobacteria bacterium]|nr:hypothetical protein [Gammaproteobacteria bacterium]
MTAHLHGTGGSQEAQVARSANPLSYGCSTRATAQRDGNPSWQETKGAARIVGKQFLSAFFKNQNFGASRSFSYRRIVLTHVRTLGAERVVPSI